VYLRKNTQHLCIASISIETKGVYAMKDEIVRLVNSINDEHLLRQIYEIIVHIM
jgi:hypothetical protein